MKTQNDHTKKALKIKNMYDPEHYKKYRDSIRISQKKYRDRIRKESIDNGTIIVKEKKTKEEQYRIMLNKINTKYKEDIEFRKNALQSYKNRYENDEEFREAKKAYLKAYRLKKKEELKLKESRT